MALTREQLQAILNELPESQREQAQKHILHAEAAGWTHIGVWTWFLCRRHVADLVGINSRGQFSFLANTRIKRNLK